MIKGQPARSKFILTWYDFFLNLLIIDISMAAILENYNAQKKVQVGKDQEKAQSEKDSHSKNRGGEKTKLTIRYLYHETYRKPNEQLFSQ